MSPQYQLQKPQEAQAVQKQAIQQQQDQQKQQRSQRRTPARVTRVLADIMVFVEVEENRTPLGLVFKPNKIEGYKGQALDTLGVVVGAIIPALSWNAETLQVQSVTLAATSDPGAGATAA